MQDNRHKVLNASKMKWRRKDLRSRSTESENTLWQHLRNYSIGYKFKRQYSVVNYVVDFYSPKLKLAIEIDGKIHTKSTKYDNYRTEYLKTLGIREIRFKNEEINSNIPFILSKIKSYFPLS